MWSQQGKVPNPRQLYDRGSAPTQDKEVKSQAWPGIRRDGILGVSSISHVKGMRLTPEAMPREERDANILLTISPLGPGAPGGPITPRSPCVGDSKAHRSWLGLGGCGTLGAGIQRQVGA